MTAGPGLLATEQGREMVIGYSGLFMNVMASLSFHRNPSEQILNLHNCVMGAMIHISSVSLPF